MTRGRKRSTNRLAMQALGRRFYTGHLCAKHPEELGRRYVSGTCTACSLENNKRNRNRKPDAIFSNGKFTPA